MAIESPAHGHAPVHPDDRELVDDLRRGLVAAGERLRRATPSDPALRPATLLGEPVTGTR
ncbi:hypothetical protein ACTU3I_04560 [Microbacterium sp. RD1]|uniref:hypothetical protein n=1 Tax=Microbacterium sp. RD1 TaxID=3457313 RepID=UPI003FA54EF1